MSIKEVFRSAMLGFMFGTLYFSGAPLEVIFVLAFTILFFMLFGKKIKPFFDNFFNSSPRFSKIPLKYRPYLTLIIVLILFFVMKRIIYFLIGYFFNINVNVDEYLNQTKID